MAAKIPGMLTLDTPRRAVLAALGAAALLTCSALPGLAAAPSRATDPAGTLRPGQVVKVAGRETSTPAASIFDGYSGDGGPATLARFSSNLSIAVAPDSGLLVADTGNGRTRRIDPDGTVRTIYNGVAGASEADCGKDVAGWKYCPRKHPESVAAGPDGSVYVVDTAVRRITRDGRVRTIAGAGDLQDGRADGGPATRAWIYRAEDVAVDRAGNVYVADTNNQRIRKIDTRGVITTVAGGGELPAPTPGDGEQPARSTKLFHPARLAVDSGGTVYFTLESRGSVYAVDPRGQLRVVAGTGDEPDGSELPAEGTPATKADLGEFLRVAVDAEDALYFTDRSVLYRVDAKGGLHVAATSVGGAVSDLAVGPNGDVYVTSGDSIELVAQAEREAEPGAPKRPATPRPADPWAGRKPGSVVTVAGSGRDVENLRSTGTDATHPSGVAVDAAGTTYVAVRGANRVFAVDRSGQVRPVAGTGTAGSGGDGGPANRAQLTAPAGVAVDGGGNLYIADAGNNRIRRVGRDGVISTVAGNGASVSEDDTPGVGTDHRPATEVRLANPSGVAVDASGNLYIADTGHSQVHRVDAKTGVLDVVAGSGTSYFEGDGGPATKAALEQPQYVAVDRTGNVYVSDSKFHSVRRIGADGKIRTIAGSGDDTIDTGDFTGDDGRADRARLNSPTGLAVDAQGNVYVADTWNNRIRRIGRDGVISTVAGTGAFGSSGDGGPALRARLGEPAAVAVTPGGDVTIADVDNGRIRKFEPGGTITLVADLEPAAGRVPASQVDVGRTERLAIAPDGRLVIRQGPWLVPFEVRAKGSYQTTRLFPGERTTVPAGEVAYSGGQAYLLADNQLSRIDADGRQVRIAGGGPLALPKQGQRQQASRTSLTAPAALTAGPDGSVYVADQQTSGIYRITTDGTIGMVATMSQQAGWPTFAVDAEGNVYRADPHGVVRVSPGGEETFVAGQSEDDYDVGDSDGEDVGDGGAATKARISGVQALALDHDGTLYIDEESGIRRVSTDGTIMTVVPAHGTAYPRALALDQHGNLYFADPDSRRVRVVVRPGALEAPSRTGPWLLGAAIGAPAALLVAVGTVVVVRRKRRTTTGETLSG